MDKIFVGCLLIGIVCGAITGYPTDQCIILIDRYSDLRIASGATAEDIDSVFVDTGLANTGKYFVEAEKRHGVNAIFLASLAALESGWGKSRIFKDKNNPFGFTAYTSSPYRSATRFSHVSDAIDYVSAYIASEYLDESGRWYNGPTLIGMNKRYSDDPKWHVKIENIAKQFVPKGRKC